MSWFGNIQLSVKLKRIWKRRRFIRKRRKYYIKLRSKKTYIKEQSFLCDIQKICGRFDSFEEGRPCLSHSCLEFSHSNKSNNFEADTTPKSLIKSSIFTSTSLFRRVRNHCRFRSKKGKGKKSATATGIVDLRHTTSKHSSHPTHLGSRTTSSKEAKENRQDLLSLDSGDQKYHKYIPVPNNYGIFYPKGILDTYFPSCWLEIQTWYILYQSEKLSPSGTPKSVSSSKSDISLGSGRGPGGDMPTTQSNNLFDERRTQVESEVTTERNSALVDHPRFGMFSNLEYLDYVRQLTNYQGRVRVQFLVGASCHPHQCHLKTNMILTCLRSFFHNGGDLEVMWTRNLIRQLPIQSLKLVFDAKIASILAMQLAEARAILFVSKEAAIMLRHPSTAFLETLARAAGVTRDQMVVLPYDLGPGQSAERMQLSLAHQEDEDSEEEAEIASSLAP